MSDPLTRAEIEDVLSSIRRLVSEEGRPPRAAAAGGGERLVLTPAQRVPAAHDPVAAIRAAARRLAEPAAASAPPPAASSAPFAAATPAGSHAPSATPASERAEGRRPTLEEAIAELEAAVAASHGEWEPDGSEPQADTAPLPPSRVPKAARAEATPVAPELPAANVHRLTGLPERPAAAAASAAAPGLDADALRDLVVEIVREELQGALGERITRNVRKLVRAEIARALASRQFD
ncbi:MAG: hypothetical protein KJZ85_02405 [Rhodobacteraceae bacterium]|jgi:hypothetical protein|nr:hypothetical protein [Paracoccaceae bacterium]